jgi:hypothetical protein
MKETGICVTRLAGKETGIAMGQSLEVTRAIIGVMVPGNLGTTRRSKITGNGLMTKKMLLLMVHLIYLFAKTIYLLLLHLFIG